MPNNRLSSEEIEILVNEVEKHVIHGKLSNTVANTMKNCVWQNITLKVNAVNNKEARNVKQIRKKWSDFTSRTKMKEAKSRREMKKTGGGPSQCPPEDPLHTKVLGIIGDVAVSGLANGIDTSESIEIAPLRSTSTAPPTASPTASDNEDDYSNDISREDHSSTSNRNTQQPDPSNSSNLVSIEKEKLLGNIL